MDMESCIASVGQEMMRLLERRLGPTLDTFHATPESREIEKIFAQVSACFKDASVTYGASPTLDSLDSDDTPDGSRPAHSRTDSAYQSNKSLPKCDDRECVGYPMCEEHNTSAAWGSLVSDSHPSQNDLKSEYINAAAQASATTADQHFSTVNWDEAQDHPFPEDYWDCSGNQ
jgi:hypothetical protein